VGFDGVHGNYKSQKVHARLLPSTDLKLIFHQRSLHTTLQLKPNAHCLSNYQPTLSGKEHVLNCFAALHITQMTPMKTHCHIVA
jgi:hypothetical protein